MAKRKPMGQFTTSKEFDTMPDKEKRQAAVNPALTKSEKAMTKTANKVQGGRVVTPVYSTREKAARTSSAQNKEQLGGRDFTGSAHYDKATKGYVEMDPLTSVSDAASKSYKKEWTEEANSKEDKKRVARTAKALRRSY